MGTCMLIALFVGVTQLAHIFYGKLLVVVLAVENLVELTQEAVILVGVCLLQVVHHVFREIDGLPHLFLVRTILDGGLYHCFEIHNQQFLHPD